MNETITIVLPLPPKMLSPNRHIASFRGRMARAAAAKKYRAASCSCAWASRIDTSPWTVAEVKAIFYHATNRRRDDVNHLQMLKPAYDGIVDAGILVDDDSKHLRTMTPDFMVDKDNPRVELTITRMA